MKIHFLHGLESTPETSQSAKLIKNNFDDVVIHDYKPKSNYDTIKKYFESYKFDSDDIVIGISLGGFWSLHITEFTEVYKVILINPALSRASRLYNKYIHVNQDVLGKMLLNMDDDIVDNEENVNLYKHRFSISTYETGGHRATNKNEMLVDIKKAVNHLSEWSG